MKVIATENIKFFKDPFPHGVAKPFFTENAYTELLAAMPPLELYDDILGEPGRVDFWIEKRFEKLQPAQKRFWAKLYRSLAYTERNLLFEPFIPAINKVPELAAAFNSRRSVPKFRLVCESEEYENLPPHLDQIEKILVVVVYLDSPTEAMVVDQKNGTALYKKRGDEFVPEKIVPFMPNTGCITVRTPDSWHGGEWKLTGQQRHTLHIYYFL